MELTGLSLGPLLATLGGFTAAILALYMLRQRRREVRVPHVAMWERLLSERQLSAWWTRLKRLWSLLLALIVVAALVFALGDPRRLSSEEGSQWVVLIDASASMQATDATPSRMQAARTQARRLIRNLAPADRALVAQLDAGVTPLSPLTDRKADLLAAIDQLQPTDLAADLDAGLAFATDVLRGSPRPRVAVISDGQVELGQAQKALEALGAPLRYVRVGEGGRNVGITAFAVRRYPLDKTRSEVLVSLRNFGEQDETVKLTLRSGDRVLHAQTVEVSAGEKQREVLARLPGADRTLTAQVALPDGTRDALPADDVAYARLPERARLKVLTVSEGNRYLEAALLLDEYLDVDEVTPAGYQGAQGYDVVIFDGVLPPAPPKTRAIYLHPEPDPEGWAPLEVVGQVQRPYVDKVEDEHPLVRWTALRDVNIAGALDVRPAAQDRVVAATKDRHPLIVTGERDAHRFVAVTFDPRQSDLPLRVAWPLLLINALDLLSGEDPDYLSSYQAGETWRIPVPDGTHEATLTAPGGTRHSVPVRDGRAVTSGDRAGFYTLEAAGWQSTFAVNAPREGEGDLTPAETLLDAADAPPEAQRVDAGLGRTLWPWLVGLALALLAAEWLTYHRRWTV